MQNSLEALRLFRPHLVRAAEKVFQEHNSERTTKPKELKSQLNHLIAVCNEATCHEEIALYLRYQAAREGQHIDPALVDQMIKGAEKIFSRPDFVLEDAFKIAAWRLYAVYLARTYTYTNAKTSEGSSSTPARAPTPNSSAQKPR